MTALERLGVFQRERKPGKRYRYVLAEAYRPRWPGRGVSAPQGGVSQAETQQATTKQSEGDLRRFGMIAGSRIGG